MLGVVDEIKKITDHLEYLFLKRIAAGLRDGSVELTTAKDLATKLLQIEPFQSFEDAKTKIHEFSKDYSFLKVLGDYIDGYHEELKKHETIEKMRSFMKTGDIDKALSAAKE